MGWGPSGGRAGLGSLLNRMPGGVRGSSLLQNKCKGRAACKEREKGGRVRAALKSALCLGGLPRHCGWACGWYVTRAPKQYLRAAPTANKPSRKSCNLSRPPHDHDRESSRHLRSFSSFQCKEDTARPSVNTQCPPPPPPPPLFLFRLFLTRPLSP